MIMKVHKKENGSSYSYILVTFPLRLPKKDVTAYLV